jgi:DNA-binding transcriptional regulator PaaX
LEGSREWVWRELHSRKTVYNSLRNLRQQGLVKKMKKKGKNFFFLTSKGELRLLLSKAALARPAHWDNFWRLLIFDIPEDCRDKRDGLRRLLKINGFVKLQTSVFIHPYPLNREAISFLKQSGLIDYIHIIKASEIDDDSDLRKKFNLPMAIKDKGFSRP